jgi:integrase
VSALFVDKLYARLLDGPRKKRRVRTANICMGRAERAWDVVARLYPSTVPPSNPFAGVERESRREAKLACTRPEAFALADAIARLGHPHLAVVPLVCFEWLQRPENVIAGHLNWHCWRPPHRPREVLIYHHKTGVQIWHPLEDEEGCLYPELEARLTALERVGVSMVVTPGAKGKPRPYSRYYARAIVRRARRAAGLPEHVTLDGCRHGGMTELGDAQLTEQAVMALSGHKTPEAARLYIKRTTAQRLAAARKRRAWVEEHNTTESQNELKRGVSE